MAIVTDETFEQLKQDVFNSIVNTFLVNQKNDAIYQGDGQKYSFHTFFNRTLRIATADLLVKDLEKDLKDYEHNLVFSDYRSDCSDLCLRWQNRVYWTQIEVKKYTYFEDAKWRAGGLFHPNCRHTVDLFYEDLKDLLLADETENYATIREEANKEKAKRYNERQLRKWREKKAKAKLVGDKKAEQKANDKIKEYEKRPHNRFRVDDYYNVFI